MLEIEKSKIIRSILFLIVVFFFHNIGSASLGTLRLLYEKQRTPYGQNFVYCEDVEQHRQEFLKWIVAHDLEDAYSRVILTLSCRDADYIPKCRDAGKVFQEGNLSYQLMHNGVKVLKDCYYGDWMTDLIYALKGHHEPQEEKAFYEVLQCMPENAVMVELGSYWAYYSLWFAKAVKNSTNYLIEPGIERLKIGQQNFQLNGMKGVFFHGYVGKCQDDAGDFRGAKQLFIDSFLEKNHIEHVNILHSDIQGSEYRMLQSAIRSIQLGKVDYFFISTHSMNIHHQCIDFLEANHFDIIVEHSPGESYSVDGLIVGKRKDISGLQRIIISKRLAFQR